MEEAEALCSRIGIMVGGRLRCIGSNQHLKARFGSGYQLEVRIEPSGDAEVRSAVENWRLPESIKREEISTVCARLGAPERAEHIREGSAVGWLIHEMLEREGCVSALVFTNWWLLEDRVAKLAAFLEERFAGTMMLERHDRTLRYRLPVACQIAEVFRALEEAQKRFKLEEYGVSQTTLEQIFNDFAAKQEAEAEAVQGLGLIRTLSSGSARSELRPAEQS